MVSHLFGWFIQVHLLNLNRLIVFEQTSVVACVHLFPCLHLHLSKALVQE